MTLTPFRPVPNPLSLIPLLLCLLAVPSARSAARDGLPPEPVNASLPAPGTDFPPAPGTTSSPAMVTGSLPVLSTARDGSALAPENPSPPAGSAPDGGLTVVTVTPGSPGEKAGIRPGDVLRSWERRTGPAGPERRERGMLRSEFDWQGLLIEQVPRGAVTLTGTRAGEVLSLSLPTEVSGVTLTPCSVGEGTGPFREGLERFKAKDPDAGLAAWARLEAGFPPGNRRALVTWLRYRTGSALADARREAAAATAYAEALRGALDEGDALAEVLIRSAQARLCRRRQDPAGARQALQASVETCRARFPGSLLLAHQCLLLGEELRTVGEFDAALPLLQEALAIQEPASPRGLVLARTLNGLGCIRGTRGDFRAAEACFRRALVIQEAAGLEDLFLAYTCTLLGELTGDRGDLEAAEAFHRRALAIREKVAPGSAAVSSSLRNLGSLRYFRGDYEEAEVYYRKALAILEKASPGGLDLATLWHNLGNLNYSRLDLAVAEDCNLRALEIRSRLAPGSIYEADAIGNLGLINEARGRYEAAAEKYSRALAIYRAKVRGSTRELDALCALSSLARARGDRAAAEALAGEALALAEKVVPGTFWEAECLQDLGSLEAERGDDATALPRLERALAIFNRQAAGSTGQAETLHEMGRIRWRQGLRPEALDLLLRAIAALEDQLGKLGATPGARANYRQHHARFYRDTLELFLEMGRETEAYQMLERSRGREFLAMLAERDLAFGRDLPPELARAWKRIEREYDGIQQDLRRLSPDKDRDRIESLTRTLAVLESRRADVIRDLRRASPRLASLRSPEPLDTAAAARNLDPGTLLLAYSWGPAFGNLFLLEPSGRLRTLRIDLGESGLRDEVERFRTLVQSGRGQADLVPVIREAGRRLFDRLLRPALPEIRRARRLLVIPDQALHGLPFGALVVDPEGKGDRYLAQWKSVHLVLSATVYAELRKQRPRAGNRRDGVVVAFGDPAVPDPSATSAAARAWEGTGLAPLPSSRAEAKAVARGFGDWSRVYLGPAATEARVKELGPEASIVHFACHGLLDERVPLNSGLLLAFPSGETADENGLLQAWEVIDRVRLSADLVTLSACSTGLGKEMGGEGLVSISRAFQYAGARTVLASLWEVSDESTLDLMKRFYAGLAEGLPKDEALRRAQCALIRQAGAAGFSHPWYWAAFQLYGDWATAD